MPSGRIPYAPQARNGLLSAVVRCPKPRSQARSTAHASPLPAPILPEFFFQAMMKTHVFPLATGHRTLRKPYPVAGLQSICPLQAEVQTAPFSSKKMPFFAAAWYFRCPVYFLFPCFSFCYQIQGYNINPSSKPKISQGFMPKCRLSYTKIYANIQKNGMPRIKTDAY